MYLCRYNRVRIIFRGFQKNPFISINFGTITNKNFTNILLVHVAFFCAEARTGMTRLVVAVTTLPTHTKRNFPLLIRLASNYPHNYTVCIEDMLLRWTKRENFLKL